MALEVSAISPSFFDLTGRILLITCEVDNDALEREFLSGNEEDTVYPGGLAYVRWEASIPGGGQFDGLEDVTTVEDTFASLQAQPGFADLMPWYGNEENARLLAQELAVAYQGGASQLDRQQGDFFGPWFAYGVDQNGSLQVVSSEGGSGGITGSVVIPQDQVQVFAVAGQAGGGSSVQLYGPWLTVYQERLAIPFKVGNFDVSIQAVPRQGVNISAEVLFV